MVKRRYFHEVGPRGGDEVNFLGIHALPDSVCSRKYHSPFVASPVFECQRRRPVQAARRSREISTASESRSRPSSRSGRDGHRAPQRRQSMGKTRAGRCMMPPGVRTNCIVDMSSPSATTNTPFIGCSCLIKRANEIAEIPHAHHTSGIGDRCQGLAACRYGPGTKAQEVCAYPGTINERWTHQRHAMPQALDAASVVPPRVSSGHSRHRAAANHRAEWAPPVCSPLTLMLLK